MFLRPTVHLERHDTFRQRAAWIAEFVLLIDVLGVLVYAAMMAVGGLDPLDSPVTWVVFAVTLIAVAVELRWERAHLTEFRTSKEHHHDRERRGY